MTTRSQLAQILEALELPARSGAGLSVRNRASLRSRYPVSDLACATLGATALTLARWINPQGPLECSSIAPWLRQRIAHGLGLDRPMRPAPGY